VGRPLANGVGADEFVSEAVDKLWSGSRAYRADLSLEENIQRVVSSDIWNWLQKSKKCPLLDRGALESEVPNGDPVDQALDSATFDDAASKAERQSIQRQLLGGFEAFVADDEELSMMLLAYEEGWTKPADIERETGIPAQRVSELKRKLAERAEKFMRQHPEFSNYNE
jgi:hypothetical protein